MTRAEKSWIMYDVANSAFVLIVVTTVMPIFFKEIAARGIAPAVSTAWWGYANSLSSAILVGMAPVMGAFADYQGWKKRLFAGFLLTGVMATALLAFTGHGAWLFCLAVFVVARTCWSGANVFYDAFITDVTEPGRMDRISTAGYAWGYIGSVIPFLMVIALILGLKSPAGTGAIPAEAARAGFVITALWWLIFSLPMLRSVRQRHFCPPVPHPLRESFGRLCSTLRQIRSQRNVFTFLLAYFFYIDGVDTIIVMSVAYGVDLGLGATSLILAILTIQIVAFPCSLLWGRLSDSFSVKLLLQAGIAVYVLITLIAFLLPSLPTLQAKTAVFWLLAILVGTSMGGIQALSRSFFGRLIPAERSAEFFGFYNIFGKCAAIAGPLLVGIFGQLAGHSRYGVLSILVLFVVGSLILMQVDEHA
ncbi:MAG: MFS transporter [Geobacteraceae bacterium]|nr:MFS transporter [Geobacteraceae bacterium]